MMNIKSEKGRPVSKRAVEARRAVAREFNKIPDDRGLTAPEIAKKTKKAKYDVLLALRYFHKTNQVFKAGTKKTAAGSGRPSDVYYKSVAGGKVES